MATVLCFKASIDFEPHEHKQRKRTLCCICATQSQSQSCNKALQVHLAWPYIALRRRTMPQLRSEQPQKWWLAHWQQMKFRILCKLLESQAKLRGTRTRTRTHRRYLINSSLHAEASQIPVSAHSPLSPLREALPHAPTTACLDYLHSLSYTKCSPVYCPHVNMKTSTHT